MCSTCGGSIPRSEICRYCYPLRISDFASRYLISCEALENARAMYARDRVGTQEPSRM